MHTHPCLHWKLIPNCSNCSWQDCLLISKLLLFFSSGGNESTWAFTIHSTCFILWHNLVLLTELIMQIDHCKHFSKLMCVLLTSSQRENLTMSFCLLPGYISTTVYQIKHSINIKQNLLFHSHSFRYFLIHFQWYLLWDFSTPSLALALYYSTLVFCLMTDCEVQVLDPVFFAVVHLL